MVVYGEMNNNNNKCVVRRDVLYVNFNDSFASIKILGLYKFSQKIKDGRQVER